MPGTRAGDVFTKSCSAQAKPQCLDRAGWIRAVDDGVTIRADWAKIADRFHDIRFADAGQRNDVVHVDEVLPPLTVALLKVEAANRTTISIVIDTGLARGCTSLVSVHCNGSFCAFHGRLCNLIWVRHVHELTGREWFGFLNTQLGETPMPAPFIHEATSILEFSPSPLNHVVPVWLRASIRQNVIASGSPLLRTQAEMPRQRLVC